MIALKSVSKRFKLYRHPSDRLLEWCHFGIRHQDFYALRHIDLEVPAGRTVGIVGANGAGKSTLLKLITGTLLPTTGTIEISGRIAALLELGTGFHPDFTGRQNIYVNGQLLGLGHDEIAALEQEIIDFSELGPFIDQPLRTYSSGMVVRLGFSIAASVNPEVLIVDEALSVGDARFSQKCTRRIQNFRDNGTTILFVSHDPAAISTLCDEAILLEGGQIRSRGLPRDILAEYNALLAAKGAGNMSMRISRASDDGVQRPRRHGTYQALITELELIDPEGRPSEVFHPGETMRLRAKVCFLVPVTEPSIGFLIKDRLGLNLYGTNTVLKHVQIGTCGPGDVVEFEADLPVNFGYGTYNVTIAVHDDETHLQACYEWIDNAVFFQVQHRGKPDWSGLTLLEPSLQVSRAHFSPADIAEPLLDRFEVLDDPMPATMDEPSPFLAGFGRVEHTENGSGRPITGEQAVFVFRPNGDRLALRVVAPDAPIEYALTVAGDSDVLKAGRDGVFTLPASLRGRASVWCLTVHGVPEGERVVLVEVRSEE